MIAFSMSCDGCGSSRVEPDQILCNACRPRPRKPTRGVRWLEDRQDRAYDAAARRQRAGLRRAIDACREADDAAAARSDELARDVAMRRATGARYARAKIRIGVYDRATGWSDREVGS